MNGPFLRLPPVLGPGIVGLLRAAIITCNPEEWADWCKASEAALLHGAGALAMDALVRTEEAMTFGFLWGVVFATLMRDNPIVIAEIARLADLKTKGPVN